MQFLQKGMRMYIGARSVMHLIEVSLWTVRLASVANKPYRHPAVLHASWLPFAQTFTSCVNCSIRVS